MHLVRETSSAMIQEQRKVIQHFPRLLVWVGQLHWVVIFTIVHQISQQICRQKMRLDIRPELHLLSLKNHLLCQVEVLTTTKCSTPRRINNLIQMKDSLTPGIINSLIQVVISTRIKTIRQLINKLLMIQRVLSPKSVQAC